MSHAAAIADYWKRQRQIAFDEKNTLDLNATMEARLPEMREIHIDTANKRAPTRDNDTVDLQRLPSPKSSQTRSQTQPSTSTTSDEATLLFIGTATTLLHWPSANLTILTDPNFLHAGDHVHLGPGVTGTRLTNPYVDLHALPSIDMVLLSHYHADHFDAHVEDSLRRDLPIVTTPHARECLVDKKGEGVKFTAVTALDRWEGVDVSLGGAGRFNGSEGARMRRPHVRIVGMPGSHVPPGPLDVANEILRAVPPTNGWIVELGYLGSNADNSGDSREENESFDCGYRIYISGDTLLVDDLKKIPEMYTHAGKTIDLMLIHLGGTTIPGPSLPLLMVTMDAKQGVELMQLVSPELTVPIHYE
jgi:L-ascorbate metabolism protein UlaG (beta-lactamase superfamily)